MRYSWLYFLTFVAVYSGWQCNLDRISDAGPFTCGQEFTDPRDGKHYKTVWIAEDGSHNPNKPGKCWMVENLDFNTANFNSNCYQGEATKCDTFGHLYGQFALANICPGGWHMATREEWIDLFDTYGWTQFLTGNGPIFNGDSATFLPGGTSKLDFLMGGSCLEPADCSGVGENTGFWGTDNGFFCFFSKSGSADVWSTGVIVGADDLRYYVRCVQD